MDIATIALIVIAVVSVVGLRLVTKGTTKKRHFEKKRDGVDSMIADLEFKVFKTLEVREEMREEYDALSARIHSHEAQIKDFKGKKEDKATIEDTLARTKVEKDRIEGQIRGLDLEVNGSKPTNEIPDGYTGIYTQIDSMRELRGMLTSWISKV